MNPPPDGATVLPLSSLPDELLSLEEELLELLFELLLELLLSLLEELLLELLLLLLDVD